MSSAESPARRRRRAWRQRRRAVRAPPIWLNAWAAEQLQAKPGAPVTLAYDVWDDAGGLVRRDATFTLAGVLPMTGAGADATLTPEYPGITGQESLSDWDPPFPLDLSRITPRDEEYWDKYRAAPKAIVTLADGQRLWGSRYGRLTSIRFALPDADRGRRTRIVRRCSPR